LALTAISISDLEGYLNYVNPAFLKLWGYNSAAEVLGKQAVGFWQMGEKAAEVIEALSARGGWSGEMVAKRKDGSLFDAQVAASLVKNAIGRPICMLASFADITELKQVLAREQHLARADALTGVNNRRYWFKLAEHEFEVALRYRQPLSVIMIYIDRFKHVNDMCGHAVGDQMLERVAQVACTELRSVDVIGRYGGDEFIIVLPMTTAQQAYPVAERIRTGVVGIRVESDKGQVAVTLSIGIAEMLLAPLAEHLREVESIERVIHRADEAMYAAKAAGRNRTLTWTEPA
jgi:diguanylate cyclase (GGDEF)-like protein/PAS domain S-box-containing protein